MRPCRTRRSTSPRETSRSISGPRNSPEATSRRRSPNALRRYVDVEEGSREGFDEIVVRVGVGAGRKVRFTGVLVGEWANAGASAPSTSASIAAGPASTSSTPSAARVVDGRRGGQACRLAWLPRARQRQLRQRAEGGDPRRRRDLEELRDKVPAELYEMVARSAQQPAVEELDI